MEAQAADPALVHILTKMVQFIQISHRQLTPTDKCVMLHQKYCNGSSPGTVRNNWAAFDVYVSFQT